MRIFTRGNEGDGKRITIRTERIIMQTKFVNRYQPSSRKIPLGRKTYSTIGFLCGTVLLAALAGCVGYVDHPRGGAAYVESPSVYGQGGMYPGYVYYPGYQVYYSGHSHQYVYRDGRSWVSRSAPPRVSANVLLASPSVRMNFQDHPSYHHATVVKQYPKHWAPSNSSYDNTERNYR
jgi:hypothetical protein